MFHPQEKEKKKKKKKRTRIFNLTIGKPFIRVRSIPGSFTFQSFTSMKRLLQNESE